VTDKQVFLHRIQHLPAQPVQRIQLERVGIDVRMIHAFHHFVTIPIGSSIR
jgi:hypothetical protein